ncbi:3'-5' exonuclease [Oryzifoliimicrobium ureilyticus]|uniref:3'-5' exonuclease n=1 Tax=Oryzifoliimicrobium ureilyticus TaxID=3113724 RepID=UPI00307624DB
MIVFLDFEASSLNKNSFPIEIAWVFEDGRSRSTLIKPLPNWTDWSDRAQSIHGISKQELLSAGAQVEDLVSEMLEVLQSHELYASAPSWDGKWLSTLLRAAGRPRHALKLAKSDDAFAKAARLILGEDVSDPEITELVKTVIEESEPPVKPAHRALPDAMLELHRWQMTKNAAAALHSKRALTQAK